MRAFPWQEDKTEPIAITKISAHEPHKTDDKGTGRNALKICIKPVPRKEACLVRTD